MENVRYLYVCEMVEIVSDLYAGSRLVSVSQYTCRCMQKRKVVNRQLQLALYRQVNDKFSSCGSVDNVTAMVCQGSILSKHTSLGVDNRTEVCCHVHLVANNYKQRYKCTMD